MTISPLFLKFNVGYFYHFVNIKSKPPDALHWVVGQEKN